MARVPRLLRATQNLPAAIAASDRAVLLARGFEADDPRLAESLVLRGEVFLWQKQDANAEQVFAEAVRVSESSRAGEVKTRVLALSSLANFYFLGIPRYERIEPLYGRILDVVRDQNPPDYPEIIRWSRNLGDVEAHLGHVGEAAARYAEALSLAETRYPAWVPYEELNAADFYRTIGDYAKAEVLISKALRLREEQARMTGDIDARLDVVVCLEALGGIQLARGEGLDARATYSRALDLLKQAGSQDEAQRVTPLWGLAESLRAEGAASEARAAFSEALAIARRTSGPASALFLALDEDSNRSEPCAVPAFFALQSH